MPSGFVVTLDRTAPPFAVEIISVGPDPTLVTLKLVSDAEAFEFRLWGAIDTGDPANTGYGTDESAEWLPFDEEIQVRIPDPDSAETRLSLQVRDDVWNASPIEVVVFGEPEAPTPEPTPARPGGAGHVEPPRRTPAPRGRKLSREETIVVSSTVTVEVIVERETEISLESSAITEARGISSSLLRLSSVSRSAAEISTVSDLETVSLYETTRGLDPVEEEALVAVLL